MSQQRRSEGVMLPEGYTGSSFFHHILDEAASAYPTEFKSFKLPSRKNFRKTYADSVVRFEAARVSSAKRSDIAKYMVGRTQQQLRFLGNGFEGSFNQYMSEGVDPAEIKSHQFGDAHEGLMPNIKFHGRNYQGKELKDLASLLRSEHKMTNEAASALNWIGNYVSAHGGVSLKGQKFVVLGASAELAPTELLLRAGAHVLWVDIQSPETFIRDQKGLSGTLSYAPDACDILLQPRKIRATIESFANGEAVNIGMFAYAAGASQEWRLAATMNAIIRGLPPSCVKSVSMLISPTSAAVMQTEDLEQGEIAHRNPPLWQSALKLVGQLNQKAGYKDAGVPVVRAIVPLQGLSYQAAQYISKTLAAEVFATHGVDLNGEPNPISVSSNVAGITKTRSLDHPVFKAAFLGAATFGVEIFEVETTKSLCNLLIIHDLINQEHVTQGNPSLLFAEQVHGGIYSRAYALDPMIKVATVLGLVKRPRYLLEMLK